MRHKLAIALVAITFLGVSPASHAQEAIERGSNTRYSGYIETGRKFGIQIGDSIETVKPKLVHQGMRYDGFSYCESYPKSLLNCAPGDPWEQYRVQKFLKDGSVYVKYENDRVVAIAWSFDLLPDMAL